MDNINIVISVIILIFVIIIAILSTRLYLISMDLRILKRDLERFDGDDFKKKLNISSGNREMEELAYFMNTKIEDFINAVIRYNDMESNLKQAIVNMSHDLRTPLTSIIGYLQLIEKEINTDEGKQYIEVINRRAKTLETLINDFFEISVIESPKYPLSIDVIDLKAVLVQHLATFYNRFQTRLLIPQVNISDEVIKIFADINAIDRIITNLLENVLQHASNNVVIDLFKINNSAVLEVSNSTENLGVEDIDKIFDKFYSADKVRNGENYGLGLPIVKALAEKLGCTINASLTDDIFTIKLVFTKIFDS